MFKNYTVQICHCARTVSCPYRTVPLLGIPYPIVFYGERDRYRTVIWLYGYKREAYRISRFDRDLLRTITVFKRSANRTAPKIKSSFRFTANRSIHLMLFLYWCGSRSSASEKRSICLFFSAVPFAVKHKKRKRSKVMIRYASRL